MKVICNEYVEHVRCFTSDKACLLTRYAEQQRRFCGTWCLNRVVQRKPEDVVLHIKAGTDRLQDKCLDVRVRLILVSLYDHQ